MRITTKQVPTGQVRIATEQVPTAQMQITTGQVRITTGARQNMQKSQRHQAAGFDIGWGKGGAVIIE
ncbi:hypothetical protein PDENDC454_07305 [Paenibacillus dendritiformis C454]|uniref:Uncharacterized protein n=1 Tax=Paenibacillus dendritiformis C454 TaxID=1131935 RepID=H3SD66_9BACL|nr:hypothetical protein PDENDC454_07305 [Paenibacillus dendritiformis C454]